MDEGARRWLYKMASKNYWRVAAWIELEDLVQDGFVCWQVVATKYPEVTDIKIFMRLFQVTYTNHLHDLANKRTVTLEVPYRFLPEETVYHFEQHVCEFGELLNLIIQAPPLIAQCLKALIFQAGLDLRAPYRTWLDGRRETFNDRLCRLLKIPPDGDNLHAALQTYLQRRM